MEAFWTKFLPQYQKVSSIIKEGEIGEIKLIQADFGFKAPLPLSRRLYDPILGGGALLDIGIYPVFMAISLLGRPVEVCASIDPYPSGVDKQIVAVLKFASGALANISASFEAISPVEATIVGGDGYVRMTNRFHNATANVQLSKGGKNIDIAVDRESGYGYQFEARHVCECLRNGLLESSVVSHDDTLLLMETLDRIRMTCGIRYPADEMK
jgi:predicted dehydrogenase